MTSSGFNSNPPVEVRSLERRAPPQSGVAITSFPALRKRRGKSDDDEELSVPIKLPPGDIFLQLTTSQKLAVFRSASITARSQKRRKVDGSDDGISTPAAQAPLFTKPGNKPLCGAVARQSPYGTTGIPPRTSLSLAELKSDYLPAPTPTVRLVQTKGRPQNATTGVNTPFLGHGILPKAFFDKLGARPKGGVSTRRSTSSTTENSTLAVPAPEVKPIDHPPIRRAFAVDCNAGNALVRWVWEELGEDLKSPYPLVVKTFRRTGVALTSFTKSALIQNGWLAYIVDLPAAVIDALDEIDDVLHVDLTETMLTGDLKAKLREVYSKVPSRTTFPLKSFLETAVDVIDTLDKIWVNVDYFECGVKANCKEQFALYSEHYSHCEQYAELVEQLERSIDCAEALAKHNAVAIRNRVTKMQATIGVISPDCPGFHELVDVAEECINGRLGELQTVMGSTFGAVIKVIIRFYLFDIEGETPYQFVYGTVAGLSGRSFWSEVISDLKAMLQTTRLSNENLRDMISIFMSDTTRYVLPPLPPPPASDAELYANRAGYESPTSTEQLHAKPPFPPDPSDVEMTV